MLMSGQSKPLSKFEDLPEFPEMRKLALEDEALINSFNSTLPPYSDFNFISMWGYNTEDDFFISRFGNNLIFRLRDYLTNKPFYTFIGRENIYETIESIFSEQVVEGVNLEIKLAGECVIENLEDDVKYIIEEDRDNFDYIYSVQTLSELKGSAMHKIKNFVNRFKALYPAVKTSLLNITLEETKGEILTLFDEWAKNKNESEHEKIALNRTLRDAERLENIYALGLYDAGKLAAFMIFEIEVKDYAQSHFAKALPLNYKGIYPFLYNETAVFLSGRGVKYFNLEQDMGIEGLRRTKEQLKPIFYLKKYKIKKK